MPTRPSIRASRSALLGSARPFISAYASTAKRAAFSQMHVTRSTSLIVAPFFDAQNRRCGRSGADSRAAAAGPHRRADHFKTEADGFAEIGRSVIIIIGALARRLGRGV